MASQDDVRRIARRLPGATESLDRFGFSVTHKNKARGFVWVWMERALPDKPAGKSPRGPRVPQPRVLAVRVASELEKAALLSADPEKFFTEPHYHGFPAVLVRLAAVTIEELRPLVTEAWRCLAPPQLVRAYDAGEIALPIEPREPVTRRRKPAAAPRKPAASRKRTAPRKRAAALDEPAPRPGKPAPRASPRRSSAART